MKHKLLVLALGLSLLFNIFVLIGFVQGKGQSDGGVSDEKLVTQVADDLKLDDQQAQVFAELHKNQRQDGSFFEESAAVIRQGIVAEMKKETPDPERLRELMRQRAELEQQRRLAGAEHFGEFLRVLSPMQRRMLSGKLGPGRAHGGGRSRPMLLERFDFNRNGQLELDEIEAAQKEINLRMKAMRQGVPPEALRRFDHNRDGRLDENEMAAMEEFRK